VTHLLPKVEDERGREAQIDLRTHLVHHDHDDVHVVAHANELGHAGRPLAARGRACARPRGDWFSLLDRLPATQHCHLRYAGTEAATR